jgi:hypothetical protein
MNQYSEKLYMNDFEREKYSWQILFLGKMGRKI